MFWLCTCSAESARLHGHEEANGRVARHATANDSGHKLKDTQHPILVLHLAPVQVEARKRTILCRRTQTKQESSKLRGYLCGVYVSAAARTSLRRASAHGQASCAQSSQQRAAARYGPCKATELLRGFRLKLVETKTGSTARKQLAMTASCSSFRSSNFLILVKSTTPASQLLYTLPHSPEISLQDVASISTNGVAQASTR